MGWNVVCQPGYMAEEAIEVATDGLGHGRETGDRGNLHIPLTLCTMQVNLLTYFKALIKRLTGLTSEWPIESIPSCTMHLRRCQTLRMRPSLRFSRYPVLS